MSDEDIRDVEDLIRASWHLSDEINYDTLRGALTEITVDDMGCLQKVVGRFGFRRIQADGDHFVPRFRGVYVRTSPAQEVRLLLDFDARELLKLRFLPEPSKIRFRLVEPIPLQLDDHL